MIDWPNSKKYVFIIIAAIVVGALYYFFLYKAPEQQYQTFNFVSGSIVAKDESDKTITIMAAEGQFIPAGIRKTFFIADGAIIQRIIESETESKNAAATFKKADFNDIKIGDDVVIQGEFTTDTSISEKTATAVSIVPAQKQAALRPKVDKSTPSEFSSTPLSVFSGIVKEKKSGWIVVEQTETITSETEETIPVKQTLVKINDKTAFRKTLISEGAIESVEDASFGDLGIGNTIVIEFATSSGANTDEAEAKSINIISASQVNN